MPVFLTESELMTLRRALREWLCSGGAKSWNKDEPERARKLLDKLAT